MRPDMKKVIVSRPRVHGYGKVQKAFRRPKNNEDDGGPTKESMRKPYGWGRKDQTDLLGPLIRFLHSKIDQYWPKVWSEICEHADLRTLMGDHLRRHVEMEVELHVTIDEDGVLRDDHGYPLNRWGWRNKFYVDPKTQQLRYIPKEESSKWRRQIPTTVFEMDGKLFHKHDDGCWYRVQMATWDGMTYITDAFMPKADLGIRLGYGYNYSNYSTHNRLQRKYGVDPKTKLTWYCVRKESANGKEINKITRKYSLAA